MQNITVQQVTRNVRVEVVRRNIIVKRPINNIVVNQVGRRGPKGDPGDPGQGLPVGGENGDILTKNSDTDYDYDWKPSNELADKNFTYSFTNQSSITIVHNLNKYPSVSIMDSAKDEVEGDVRFIDLNTIEIAFSASFSGMVTLN